jgi:hypothetical protein
MITDNNTYTMEAIDTLADTATPPVEEVVEILEEAVVMHENTLEGLFGQSAHLVEHTLPDVMEQAELTGGWFVGIFLVAMFVYYLFILFAYGGHIGTMGKVLLSNNLGIRVADELSYLFMRAVRNAIALGISAWSLVVIKWIEIEGMGPEAENSWQLASVIGGALALGLVQRFATIGIFSLVRRREVCEGVNVLADTIMALAAIVVTPLALLLTLNTGQTTLALGWACVVVGGVAMMIFCLKSLILFIGQKISILLWFLYLCTVILIPIGVVITLVVRSGAA